MKKGFILSLDALIATVIVFIIFISVLFNTSAGENITQKMSVSKKGSDIAALLDHNKKLDSLNETTIANELSSLSKEKAIKLNITYSDSKLTYKNSILIGNEPKGFVSPGKRFFVIINGNTTKFAVVKYKIGEK